MSLSILVIDDHEPMRTLLRKVLERAGAQVRDAASGDAALALLDEALPHLVLSDYSMPGMSGADLVAALRARAGVAVRIIVLTGHASATVADAARAAGADAVLVKPVAPSALLAAIAQVMDGTFDSDDRRHPAGIV